MKIERIHTDTSALYPDVSIEKKRENRETLTVDAVSLEPDQDNSGNDLYKNPRKERDPAMAARSNKNSEAEEDLKPLHVVA